MAIAYQSIQTNTTSGGTTNTVTAPSGIQVGDLLIGVVAHSSGVASPRTVTPPSGFTLIRRDILSTETDVALDTYYKIADSGDVAAANFTFTLNAAASGIWYAVIVRNTGPRLVSTVAGSNGGNNTTGNVSISGATPALADSLIFLFALASDNSGSASMSDYAIATSSPTFTEIAEITNATRTLAIAYGLRSAITATGDATITLANSNRWCAQIVIFSPGQDATISETVSLTESIIRGIGVIVLDTVSLDEDITISEKQKWSTLNKNVSDWDNLDKS